jgi:hypothetical protein
MVLPGQSILARLFAGIALTRFAGTTVSGDHPLVRSTHLLLAGARQRSRQPVARQREQYQQNGQQSESRHLKD